MITKPFKGAGIQNITQGFHQMHRAIDWLPSPTKAIKAYGYPLVAPEKCKVGKIYGNTLTEGDAELKNGYGVWLKGLETGYEHLIWHTLPVLPINTGDIVERGQIVAFCGNSGNVFSGGGYVPLEERLLDNKAGTHLHQAVLKDGVPIDPLSVMDLTKEPSYTLFDHITALTKTIIKAQKLF